MPCVTPTFFPFPGRKLFIDFLFWFGFLEMYYVLPRSVLLQWGQGECVPCVSVGVKLGEVWHGWTAQDESFFLWSSAGRASQSILNFCNLPKNVLATVAETIPRIIRCKYTDAEGCIHLNGKGRDLAISISSSLSKDVFSRICQKPCFCRSQQLTWCLWL